MSLYLIIGSGLFVFACLVMYRLLGRFHLSYFFVFLAFYLHMFVDPAFRVGVDYYFNEASLGVMYYYNVASYFLLILGFSLYCIASRRRAVRNERVLRVFLSNYLFLVSFVLIFVVFIVLMLGMNYFGRFDGSKGQFSYGGGGGAYRALVAFSYCFYSIVPAMFVSSVFDCPPGRQRNVRLFLSVACVFFVAIYSMSQFGRQAILFVVAVIAIIYIDRYQGFRLKQLVLTALFFVVVTSFSMLRGVGEGLSNIDSGDVTLLLAENKIGLESYFRSLGTILPGQAVFSNVIDIVPDRQDFFLGKTYLESILRVFIPDFIVGDLISPPPATWYKDTYLSYVSNHGFDFSMVAETYMNFSFFGVLLFMFIGVAVGYFGRKVSVSESPIIIIFSAIMLVNIVVGLRNDSNAFLVRSVYFIVPFAFMNILPVIYRKRS